MSTIVLAFTKGVHPLLEYMCCKTHLMRNIKKGYDKYKGNLPFNSLIVVK
jgi:hypothetical protein